jgi:hypothetical protein
MPLRAETWRSSRRQEHFRMVGHARVYHKRGHSGTRRRKNLAPIRGICSLDPPVQSP